MSRRRIAHAERQKQTENGHERVVYALPAIKGPEERAPYKLYAGGGDHPKQIAVLSCRFGRAIRRATREGRYYPNAFMAYDLETYRYYIHVGLENHLRGQEEARAAVVKSRVVDWDSETINDVLVDVIRRRAERAREI